MCIEYKIECLPEDEPIKGNAMASGNEDVDRAAESSIEEQLENGNEWAWCTIHVTASYGGMTGDSYLGCCSYESETDFVSLDDYYDDMKHEAKNDLIAKLKAASIAYRELGD